MAAAKSGRLTGFLAKDVWADRSEFTIPVRRTASHEKESMELRQAKSQLTNWNKSQNGRRNES